MAELRITKKMKFEALLNALQNKALPYGLEVSDLEDFILHETDLLNKKNGSKKPTKTQLANEELKVNILEGLAKNEGFLTISDMQDKIVELKDLSNQKISSMLTQLVRDGKIERKTEKRQTSFKFLSM